MALSLISYTHAAKPFISNIMVDVAENYKKTLKSFLRLQKVYDIF